ncbi:polysaccharide biosynthesis tyrosine autokinase [Blastococcus sp. LR1]|uniref:polysaccharide biosynthesis tyrosine autokinase n=1 Tax=Blastococcus sp. LR1 TaxID=2877000 RepID=UPI001CCF5DCB|nr:polysaccharide biosynthesis tyrosine autokinase [Blastococcus sp. LR1]MCA0144886.1 polysaccharide biosynthesis tyrosine autokinase [Blastococcus sp. LR1]
MDVREILAAMRNSWWAPAIGLILGASVALGVCLIQTPLYESRTQLFVSTANSGTSAEAFQGSQFSQQRVASYARLLGGDELANRVIGDLGLDVTPQDFSSMVSAVAVTDTVLLEVVVSDTSAQRAQLIAESIGDEFPGLVAELETADEQAASPVKVTVTDAADVASAPSSPVIPRSVALGAIVGLLVGGGLALLRAHLDRTVKEPEVAAEMLGAPVIGTILRDPDLEHRHLVGRGATGRSAEDFRQLRTNLQFLSVDHPPKIIMVTSAVPSEGKTTTVVNLALALVDAGQRVTIVEADLRKPKVTKYLDMVAGVGLTNVLAGTAEVGDVIQTYGSAGLSIIGAGPTPPNPGELLSSRHMSVLLENLRDENDFVLVDAPPLLPVADASGLASAMDGVLVAVRYGVSTKDQLRQAAMTLQRVQANTLGAILSIVPPKAQIASAYGYGYSYEADSTAGRGKRRA